MFQATQANWYRILPGFTYVTYAVGFIFLSSPACLSRVDPRASKVTSTRVEPIFLIIPDYVGFKGKTRFRARSVSPGLTLPNVRKVGVFRKFVGLAAAFAQIRRFVRKIFNFQRQLGTLRNDRGRICANRRPVAANSFFSRRGDRS